MYKIECDECHNDFDQAMQIRIAGCDEIFCSEDCLQKFIEWNAEEVVDEHMDDLLEYYEQKAQYLDSREAADA